jgi:hypothetical protein
MSVRIETDGRLTVFAGANNRLIATAAPTIGTSGGHWARIQLPHPKHSAWTIRKSRALMARIDAVGETGLDGHDLRELGLKMEIWLLMIGATASNGSLTASM